MRGKLLVLAVLSAVGAGARARVCNEQIAFATPTARFVDNRDGTVADLHTGLSWMRCPVGFAFDDGGTPALTHDDRCTPGATTTFGWQAALQGAAALNQGGGYAGHADWRLPSIKELASIVETRCAAPSINLAVFPGTPGDAVFWSSSYQVGPPTFTSVQGVDFATGEDALVIRTGVAHVRLVR